MSSEASFDAIVGPTHNFSGLSPGNLAALQNKGQTANPRRAAREGLAKMRLVASLGVPQAVLPPQERPHLPTLRRLGFSGSDESLIAQAARRAPFLLAQVSSSSSMWAANSATVIPSIDAEDGRVHFVVANLAALFHRSLEAEGTARIFRAIFSDPACFAVHDALPTHPTWGDEGAANHMRIARAHKEIGLHVLVFGRSAAATDLGVSSEKPLARQTREASEAVARLGRLPAGRALFLAQSPLAIAAGAFHNDVVSTSNEGVFFGHAGAFDAQQTAMLVERCQAHAGDAFKAIFVPEADFPLAEAISSYLFNGQLLRLPTGGLAFIAPSEAARSEGALRALDRLRSETGLGPAHFVEMGQSMKNGGGPACVRLRVVLTPEERARVAPGVWLDDARADQLARWIDTHYRDRLSPEDLADPALVRASYTALDALTQILGLGSIYDFQRDGGK